MSGDDGSKRDDGGWVKKLFAQQRFDEADRMARAKAAQHAASKEPFDLDRFEELYDTSTEMGSRPAREVRERAYEHRYYLQHPQLRTLKELADLMRQLEPWRDCR